MPLVEFEFSPDDQYQQLIQALFEGQDGVQRVKISDLPGGHAGLSSLTVLLAELYGVGDSERNPLIVRIGLKAAIDEERHRYEEWAEPYTGLKRAQKRLYATLGSQAAIAYDYLRRDPKHPLQTLREFLSNESGIDPVCHSITDLFRSTLGPTDQRNGWYNDSRAYADQRPL